MAEFMSIGVDIGGTKMAFVLMDANGNVLAEHRLPTQPENGSEAVLDHLAQGITHLFSLTDHPVQGIGIGCPGHVDPEQGIVRNAVNLGWAEVDLRGGVQKRLAGDLPIWIQKDANAAALGEKYYGAARSCTDFVYLAIGTGLGGAAVVSDTLVIGANAYAMEVGHFSLRPGGRLCGCGMMGCPEMYVSGVGLLAGVAEHAPHHPDSPLKHSNPTTAHILKAAAQGDALALKVLDEAVEWLVHVIVICAGLFNPALFVIGGGLGHAARDRFIDQAGEQLNRRLLPASREGLRLVESQVQHSAIGAASLVWYAQENRVSFKV
jgi:glucokinase